LALRSRRRACEREVRHAALVLVRAARGPPGRAARLGTRAGRGEHLPPLLRDLCGGSLSVVHVCGVERFHLADRSTDRRALANLSGFQGRQYVPGPWERQRRIQERVKASTCAGSFGPK
jgi:hypothetical protein